MLKGRRSLLLRKILPGILVFVVLFAAAGFFAVPPLLKSLLIKKIAQELHRDATIGDIRFNPFRLTAEIKNFSLKELNGTEAFVSFEKLFLIWRRCRFSRGASF